jgi:hypothetical protein
MCNAAGHVARGRHLRHLASLSKTGGLELPRQAQPIHPPASLAQGGQVSGGSHPRYCFQTAVAAIPVIARPNVRRRPLG